MKEFKEAQATINRDIDMVFLEISEEIHKIYFIAESNDLIRLKNSVMQYMQTIILNKRLLLLDTALNYLTDAARRALEGSEDEDINVFYEQNQHWIEEIKAKYQSFDHKDEVMISSDPRFIYSAGIGLGASALGCLVGKTILSLELPILTPLAVASGISAAILTYLKSAPIAMQKIEKDVKKYLHKTQIQTKLDLNKTFQNYIDRFNKVPRKHQES
jgi:hypothetical protein